MSRRFAAYPNNAAHIFKTLTCHAYVHLELAVTRAQAVVLLRARHRLRRLALKVIRRRVLHLRVPRDLHGARVHDARAIIAHIVDNARLPQRLRGRAQMPDGRKNKTR